MARMLPGLNQTQQHIRGKNTDAQRQEKFKASELYLATPFRPLEKYGIAPTALAAIIATESDGVTKNLKHV